MRLQKTKLLSLYFTVILGICNCVAELKQPCNNYTSNIIYFYFYLISIIVLQYIFNCLT